VNNLNLIAESPIPNVHIRPYLEKIVEEKGTIENLNQIKKTLWYYYLKPTVNRCDNPNKENLESLFFLVAIVTKMDFNSYSPNLDLSSIILIIHKCQIDTLLICNKTPECHTDREYLKVLLIELIMKYQELTIFRILDLHKFLDDHELVLDREFRIDLEIINMVIDHLKSTFTT